MTILTIGHSNHEAEQFIELLRQHRVTALADVRSSPYSRRYPQYSKSQLGTALRAAGIAYVFLGGQLGGRPQASLLTRDGYADYVRMAQQPGFRAGLTRLNEGADRYQLALMCSEADPADCHRALLVGRQLAAEGAFVEHIHRDGSIEPHRALEERLLVLASLAHEDLFTPLAERLNAAYLHRAAKVAWRAESAEDDE